MTQRRAGASATTVERRAIFQGSALRGRRRAMRVSVTNAIRWAILPGSAQVTQILTQTSDSITYSAYLLL
jgi:hypothetical protein